VTLTRIVKIFGLFLLVIAVVAGAETAAAAPVAGFKVLHSFSGTDGGAPNSLIQAADGFFYGSAANGGDVNSCPSDGCGLLFKSDTAGTITILHVFHATDGYFPTGLAKGSDGNFYGTTISGGQPSGGGGGTFFRMDSAGNFTVLYAFVGGACCDGASPSGPPIQATDGNFYGTTGAGGAFRDAAHPGGFGTVYQFSPVSGQLTILHSFNLPENNGIFPNNPLLQASDGLLYGTTTEGAGAFHTGGGTAFGVDTSGKLSRLAVISLMEPVSSLIQAKDGFFYEVGQSTAGSVFRLDAKGKLLFIHRFDGVDGLNPHFGLVQATDGFLYGTTSEGGLLDFQGGDIFRISTLGAIGVMHSFVTTGSDGFSPHSTLIQGIDGARERRWWEGRSWDPLPARSACHWTSRCGCNESAFSSFRPNLDRHRHTDESHSHGRQGYQSRGELLSDNDSLDCDGSRWREDRHVHDQGANCRSRRKCTCLCLVQRTRRAHDAEVVAVSTVDTGVCSTELRIYARLGGSLHDVSSPPFKSFTKSLALR
jgi:uncharacterized repeat protein (TIGR03803 family)